MDGASTRLTPDHVYDEKAPDFRLDATQVDRRPRNSRQTGPMTLPTGEAPPQSLLQALSRVRSHAEEHMDRQDRAGLGWSEEAVTEVAIGAGIPFLKPIPFNRNQESTVGADWLWWWLDSSSQECFGMLVQAKRLKHEGTAWKVDVSHGSGSQRRNLLDTADAFEVAAVYSIYMGGMEFRRDRGCPHGATDPCERCVRMAITLMPAISLSPDWSKEALADVTFAEGVPLEDLGDPNRSTGVIRDVNFSALEEGELRTFLVEGQEGPRKVAKNIFGSVARRRSSQKSAALAETITSVGAQVFQDLPRDRGHFGVSYYSHVLRGLRKNPPNHLRDVIAGFRPPAEVSDRVAGIVLVVS